MKYLLLLLSISILSCDKDNEPVSKYNPPPTVASVQTSTEVVNGIPRPKFTITLNVPDTAATKQFFLSIRDVYALPLGIANPKTGVYTIVDLYNPYPIQPGKNFYASFFLMEDNTTIHNSTFQIN